MSATPRTRIDHRLEEVRRFLHTALDHPELLETLPEEVYVPTEVDVASLFAPERLALLYRIGRSTNTVGELAHSLHRKVPSVSRDLRLLESHGLIRFRTEGRRKYPELLRHFVVLPLHSRRAQATVVA